MTKVTPKPTAITSSSLLSSSSSPSPNASNNSVNKEHYETHTSSSYDSAYFYSPGEYTTFLSNKVKQTLSLGSINANNNVIQGKNRWLLDIGGGTGTFTKMIMDDNDNNSNMNAVVLDPYFTDDTVTASNDDIDFDKKINNNNKSKLYFVKGTAEDLNIDKITIKSSSSSSWWKKKDKYNYCLMKEVIHHLPDNNNTTDNDRINIFRGILSILKENNDNDSTTYTTNTHIHTPSLLIVTRPKYDIDYPMWQAAKDVWVKNQPSVDGIINDLQVAGFSNVQYNTIIYPCRMNINKWCDMVKGKVWSTFSYFTDDELDKACDWIKDNVDVDDDKGNISFEDRLIFITAMKQKDVI